MTPPWMLSAVPPYSTQRMTRSDRLRRTGWTVLAAGAVVAAIRYWVAARDASQLDDTTALGYTKSLQHGMGVMMGRSGLILMDISNLLGTPIGQALIVMACAALLAAYFFRVAWVIDDDDARQPR